MNLLRLGRYGSKTVKARPVEGAGHARTGQVRVGVWVPRAAYTAGLLGPAWEDANGIPRPVERDRGSGSSYYYAGLSVGQAEMIARQLDEVGKLIIELAAPGQAAVAGRVCRRVATGIYAQIEAAKNGTEVAAPNARHWHCREMPEIAALLGHTPLAHRAMNSLSTAEVTTLEQLTGMSDCELLAIRGIGPGVVAFIRDRLSDARRRRPLWRRSR
jgi:hypothetical protein